MIKKLKYMPYAQAHIETHADGAIELWSYETMVLRYNHYDNTLYCSGLYSMTTRKHISAFLKEYLPHIPYTFVRDMSLYVEVKIG